MSWYRSVAGLLLGVGCSLKEDLAKTERACISDGGCLAARVNRVNKLPARQYRERPQL